MKVRFGIGYEREIVSQANVDPAFLIVISMNEGESL